MSKTRIPMLIATLAVVGTLAACATPRETSTAVGAGVGAGVGGVIGNQIKR